MYGKNHTIPSFTVSLKVRIRNISFIRNYRFWNYPK